MPQVPEVGKQFKNELYEIEVVGYYRRFMMSEEVPEANGVLVKKLGKITSGPHLDALTLNEFSQYGFREIEKVSPAQKRAREIAGKLKPSLDKSRKTGKGAQSLRARAKK